jgi:general secretion pathway protein L
MSALGYARRFLRWWAGELAAIARQRSRAASARDGPAVVFDVAGAEASLWAPRRGGCEQIGRWRADTPAAAGEREIAAALRSAGALRAIQRGRLAMALRLPSESAAHTIVRLPLAVEAELRDALAMQIERLTPFRADAVRFGWRVVTRDAAAGTLSVELVVVPGRIVDDALAVLRRLGIVPDRVAVAREGADAASVGIALVGDERAASGSRFRRSAAAAAALGLAALVAADVWIPLRGLGAEAERLEGLLDAARRVAKEDAAIRARIEEIRGDASFLAERKRRAPTVSEILAETTRLVPDGDWLQELMVSGSEIQMTGLSAAPDALIAAFERSQLFGHASFRAPVTRDSKSGQERFQIAVRLGKDPAPRAGPAPVRGGRGLASSEDAR